MSEIPPVQVDPIEAFDAWMMVNGPFLGGGCLGLFGIGMLIAGVMSIQNGLRSRRVAKHMHEFAEVIGEVVDSKVSLQLTKNGGRMYYPYIQYAYVVKGKTYKSINILPGQFNANFEEAWAQSWVDKYPVGQRLYVFYDARQPKICVVERRAEYVPKDSAFSIGTGLLLLAIALGVLWAVIFTILPEGGKPLPADFGKSKTGIVQPAAQNP